MDFTLNLISYSFNPGKDWCNSRTLILLTVWEVQEVFNVNRAAKGTKTSGFVRGPNWISHNITTRIGSLRIKLGPENEKLMTLPLNTVKQFRRGFKKDLTHFPGPKPDQVNVSALLFSFLPVFHMQKPH